MTEIFTDGKRIAVVKKSVTHYYKAFSYPRLKISMGNHYFENREHMIASLKAAGYTDYSEEEVPE